MRIFTSSFLVIILLASHGWGADQSPPSSAEIRNLMLQNWERLEDYEVDIKLAVDIPGFRMPSRKIHYLYKAPDKSKIEVKGFAVVPKQGIQPFITFLRDSVELVVVGDSLFAGRPVFQVSLTDTFMNRVGTIMMLVDKESGSVQHVNVSSEEQDFFEMVTKYEDVKGIQLPIHTEITMHFPPDFKNIQRLGKKPTDMAEFDAMMTDEWLEGTIEIQFKKYKVNQGLPDYLFEDNEEDIIQD